MAETVGSLIDKLIIAEIRLYHMREQMEEPTDAATTCERFERRGKLRWQRDVLAVELNALITNPPNPFYQFKMYHTPTQDTK